MYKMIAIDLDGTLLNDEKEISKEDIEWVNKAYNEKGVIPVITTGRNVSSIEHFAHELGRDVVKYVISQNGAIIKNMVNDEYISQNMIPDEIVKKVIEIFKRYNISVTLETAMYVISDTKKSEEVMELYDKLGDEIRVIEDLRSYDISNEQISIVTGEGEKGELENIIGELEKLPEILVVPISRYLAKNGDFVYERYYIEMTAKGVSKGAGITKLANYLGIKNEEVMAIGDGENDIAMFEEGRLKIAMENSSQILKEKADYITVTNNEAGVAKAIKKYIFDIQE